jgi:hypothetical protein
MALTAAQTAIQTKIAATPALQTMASNGDITSIVNFFNSVYTPNVALYNPAAPTWQMINAMVFADVVALTAPQLSYLTIMLSQPTVDGTNANIGNAIGTMFAGKQTLTNLQALTRNATQFEFLFTTNHIVTPPYYGYTVPYSDVTAALGIVQ